MSDRVRVPLLGALLLLPAIALAGALVPAGIALDRRVTLELRRAAEEDLGRAPIILEDRNVARAEALAMHAMTVAATAGLAEAVAQGRNGEAAAMAREAAAMYGEEPVLVAPDGTAVVGPSVGAHVLEAVQRGESRVEYVYEDGAPSAVGLVALSATDWMGAAGSAQPLDAGLATALSALTRAEVTVLGADGRLVASTLDTVAAVALAGAVAGEAGRAASERVRELPVDGAPTWVAEGDLGGAATVLFSRSVADELAALPGVRRSAVVAGGLALLLALLVGTAVAVALARPVHGLVLAADRVSAGDFEAPVPSSRLEEVDRLGHSFRAMRESLRRRIEELGEANRALEDRQTKLHDLQAELIRQDRLASSARMAAELAHEIRNPVANVRNCLEVVRRRLPDGSEASHFADMAIDELLRMHELAEHLLDLQRPADPRDAACTPAAVARQVATLAAVGERPVAVTVSADGDDPRMAVAPDVLKQILFTLVENAREAVGNRAAVEIRVSRDGPVVRVDVLDEGPGIAPEALPHLFDPFFTTKEAVHGVGLGLFVAEGLVRRYGGRMEAANRSDGPGARFRVEAPVAEDAP